MRSEELADARTRLEAWREGGADRLDPVRFRFMEALARRADCHGGEARQRLEDRLSTLLAAYGDALESAAGKPGHAGDPGDAGRPALPRPPARGPLAELVDHVASQAQAKGDVPVARAPVVPRRSAAPEPAVMDYFRDTWSRIRTSRQLEQSLQQVPEHAGPLNSRHLMHRSLSLMRELSPEYLHQFLSYVDALAWLEQMNGAEVLPAKDGARGGSARKKPPARGKPR